MFRESEEFSLDHRASTEQMSRPKTDPVVDTSNDFWGTQRIDPLNLVPSQIIVKLNYMRFQTFRKYRNSDCA